MREGQIYMSIAEGNLDKFLTSYNKLDDYMKDYIDEDEWTPNTDSIKKIIKKKKILKNHEHELKLFDNFSDSSTRDPERFLAKPMEELHDYTIKKYDHIVKEYVEIKSYVMSPLNVVDGSAINEGNIYTVKMEANALEVMGKMNKCLYTHVPVIENGKLIGVFSKNTIFSYIVKNQDVIIGKETLIKEFSNFITINNHESEYFEFIAKNNLISKKD